MGRFRWPRHSVLTFLFIITFTLLKTAQSNTRLEIGEGNPAVDEEDELWNARKCPDNSFIAGFSARFTEQDSKVTALRFYCTKQHVLSELPEHAHGHRKKKIRDVFDVEIQADATGVWRKELLCRNGVINAIQVKLITTHSAADPAPDGFARDLRLRCSDGEWLQYGEQEDDYWHDEVGVCHEKQAACGFQSPFSVLHAPTSVRLECCDVPDPSTTCKPKKNLHKVTHCDNPISSTLKTCTYSKRVGMSYAGKDQQVRIYEDLGFQLIQAAEKLHDKMLEITIDPMSDNDGGVDPRNWLPEPEEPEPDDITAVPGFSTTVYQLIGHCGFYKIRFNSFTAESVEMEAESLEDDEKDKEIDEAAKKKGDSKLEEEETHEPEKHDWGPRVQEWLTKHDLKGEDLDELMQADAQPWDPDDDWGDADEKHKQDSESSEESWELDFSESEPQISNTPIQNSEKIDSVSNPHEMVVDVPLSSANLVKPPQPPPAEAAAHHQHDEDTHDHGHDHQEHDHSHSHDSNKQTDEDDGDSFFDSGFHDDFFNDESEEQDNRRDSSGFSSLKTDDDDVEDNHNHRNMDHGHGHNQQQQLMDPDNDLLGEGQKILKEISDTPIVRDAQEFVNNVRNTILDNLSNGGDDDDQHAHDHDHDSHDHGHDHQDLDKNNNNSNVEGSESSTTEPPKVNNAILGYIVGGMVVAVCIIVIIIFVLEKRKPRPRGNDPAKRSEYTSNLEPRLLGGGDGKSGEKRITIEAERETA